mmetsp:Transcript_8896/g.14903  ORF Transcript_8896/g.14903 Transcript_8896/m.14903 type:complete len:236 (-) Transcript_8896:342-1049(-)
MVFIFRQNYDSLLSIETSHIHADSYDRLRGSECHDGWPLHGRHVEINKEDGDFKVTLIDNPRGRGCIISKLSGGRVRDREVALGDTVLEINGEWVRSHQQAVKIINSARVMTFLLADSVAQSVALENTSNIGITLTGQLGDATCVTVQTTEEGGAAAAAGIFPGDEILAIDGIPPSDHAHGIKLLQASDNGVHVLFAPPRQYVPPSSSGEKCISKATRASSTTRKYRAMATPARL